MTALPASTDFTGAAVTEAGFKTAITGLRDFLSELLGTSGTDKVAALTALGALLCDSLSKTGAYTVVAADKGKVLTCSGTFTLTLTAAATLGDAFAFSVWNTGSGTITIDPNGSETIDGATTQTVAAGKFALVYCDGTKFGSLGIFDTTSLLDTDIGYGAIGCIAMVGSADNYGGIIASGATATAAFTGGNLCAVSYSGTTRIYGAALSGTWRNLGADVPDVANWFATMQRIS